MMDWGEFTNTLRNAFRGVMENVGYTDVFIARLGNGDPVNPVVRIPGKPGYVYVYREVDGSNEIAAVYDCNGMIPFRNDSAGMVVFCGYRPGESKRTGADPVIFSTGASGGGTFNYFGGITPNQLEQLYQAVIMPQRWGWMHVLPNGGFELQLPGGWGRHGNTRVKIPKQIFGDVGSHQPSGTNEARYVSCSIHVLTGDKSVVAGDIFAYSGGTLSHDANDAYLPTVIPDNHVHLGWVFLYSAQTKIKKEHIHFAPDIFYVPDATLVVTPDYLIDDAGNALMDDAGNFLISESSS